MKTKAVLVALGALGFVLSLGVSAEAQLPKNGKFRGVFGTQAVGQVHQIEKGHLFFVGEFHGVFFNDAAGGFIDKTQATCPGVNDIVDGVSIANHGYCTITDRDGDKIFVVWKGKGTGPGVGGGDFQWTGGTGKFAGIKGDNTYRYTGIGDTPAFWVVWEGEWHLP